MRLLDRYQLREFFAAFGYCLAGILVFWMSFELLGEIRDLRERGVGGVAMLEYHLHRLPLYLLLQIPVALLLALLYVLTQHSRHNELVAMRAAGIGVWRISLPYLVVGALLSGLLLAINEFAVPDAAARAEAVPPPPHRGPTPCHPRRPPRHRRAPVLHLVGLGPPRRER